LSYELRFDSKALQEWESLDQGVRSRYLKVLARRIQHPHVTADSLSGELTGCYKIVRVEHWKARRQSRLSHRHSSNYELGLAKCPNLACRSRGAYVTGFVPHYETFTQKPIVLAPLSTGKTKYSQYSARQKPL
jgi:hypothetical protein